MRHDRICSSVLRKGVLGERLRTSVRLQRILERVHAAGPRPCAELLIELLEASNADPVAVLERLEAWARLDPRIVKALGADRFPSPPLDLVPRERKR